VHAAAQIQAQGHRLGAELGQPVRGLGRQAQGNDVALAQALLQRVGGLQLLFGLRETHHPVTAVGPRAAGLYALGLQSGIHLGGELRR